MSEKQSWNAIKKELWKQDSNVLMQKLQELETEKQKMEVQLRQGRANRIMQTNGIKVNLGEIKRRIACIKTMLNVKLLSKSKR